MRNYLSTFLSILTVLTIIGCAQQTSPTGGPKDTIPPNLVSSVPKHGTTEFKGQSVELQFDELLVLNAPQEQIIITPDIDKKYNIKIKKDKVVLEFDNRLKDSTTYSFNFRDAIQDITEKNPAENLKLAFSTGSYIDSLSIRGYVTDPMVNAPPKDATVALYISDTFNIFKHKPTYLTKSTKRGRFTIENLKPGRYYVYAFEDRNRNLIVDSKSETYGFLTDTVDLSDDIILNPISMIKLDARELKLTSARPYNTYSNIKTTKGLATYQIRTPSQDTVISSFGEDRSNIKIYNTFHDADSTEISFVAIDSLGNKIDTTLHVKFNKKKIEPEKFDSKLEDVKIFTSDRILTASLTFSKPVVNINLDSAYVTIDSTTRVHLQRSDLTWHPQTNTAKLRKSLDKKYFPTEETNESQPQKVQTWLLELRPATFISIENDSSADLTQNIRRLTRSETGVILTEIQTDADHFIVELVDKSFKVIQRVANRKNISFQNVVPGDYLLRVILDRNADGQWTPGNFEKRIPTDRIIYYRNEQKNATINLKPNWELGPLLISTD